MNPNIFASMGKTQLCMRAGIRRAGIKGFRMAFPGSIPGECRLSYGRTVATYASTTQNWTGYPTSPMRYIGGPGRAEVSFARTQVSTLHAASAKITGAPCHWCTEYDYTSSCPGCREFYKTGQWPADKPTKMTCPDCEEECAAFGYCSWCDTYEVDCEVCKW